MAYKQQPKSPVLKALVGDQHKLPKVLKDAILASPAKQTARPADPPKMSDAERKMMESAFAPSEGPSVIDPLRPSGYGKLMTKKTGKKMGKKVAKEIGKDSLQKLAPSSPAKQSTYRGGYYKTDAQMADRQRRVDGGLPVRRQDYAPGPEGQKAFKADRSASMHNRIAWKKDLRNKVISGEITAAEAGKARRDFGKEWQANASSKRTKADRDKNDAISTYVWTGKGFKRKVSDAEKASYESVSGGKSPAKQTKKDATSKYGKRHDKLRAKARKLEDKSYDSLSTNAKKFDKLQSKAEKKFDKARDIRAKKDAKSSPAKQTKSKPEHTTSRKKTEQVRAELSKKDTRGRFVTYDRTDGERSKKMGVTTVKERQAQRDAARKAERKSGPSNPRKMSQPKVKNKGPKQTLDGNVIKYSKNSPAKVKDPVTGKKVKGYAKANDKVSKVRGRKERKETKAELKATAKADGKITRLERKGINKSTRDLKTSQKNKRVVEFQKQKTKDVVSKENQRLRNKAKKLNDAVNVGYSQPKAQKKYAKTAAKADKRIGKAKEVEKRAIKNSKM